MDRAASKKFLAKEGIPLFDYVVQPNDTIYSITRLFGITTAQLLALNPEIADRNLTVGQTLRISEQRAVRPTIEVNGFTYPWIDATALALTLPYLTYLSISGYLITPDGLLLGFDETGVIEAARNRAVAPLMVVSNALADGTFFSDLAHAVLSDAEQYQALILQIVAILKAKNYYGVNINFEVSPPDLFSFAEFLQVLTSHLRPLGYLLIVSSRISILLDEQQLLRSVDELFPFNNMMDRLLLRSSGWACAYRFGGPSYIDELQQAIDFAVQLISSPKILISIPNCCYDWRLTGQQSELYHVLSSAQADALVSHTGGVFRIDPRSRTSHFTYVDANGYFHEVLCEIDTNLRAPLDLIETYNLGGVSFRNIDDFSIISYQMVSAMFEIRKLISV